MDSVDNFISALEELQSARSDYAEQAKNCEYDRGYFLADEIDRVNRAKKELADLFESEVKRIVIDVINKKEYLPI